MKMKKLLAGVLSAAMVATMIPASMAFSSVSAEVPEAVATYDLTTDAGREGWVAGGAAANIATDENGVTFSNGYVGQNQNYSIANPLNGKATNGFSVALTVTVPAGTYVNAYESMFNFNGVDNVDTDGVFSVSGNGGGVHYNDWNANFWDITSGTAVDLTAGSIFILTVDVDNNMNLYSNGVLVNSFNQGNIVATGTVEDVVNYVNDMMYFSLGAAPAVWGQPAMTVSAVSFYSSALSDQDVASLGAYEPPVVEPGEVDIASGLVGAYTFDDGTATNVITGEVGTTVGATFADGTLNLVGQSDTSVENKTSYATLPVSFENADTDGITISTWMKADVDSEYADNIYTVLFGMEKTGDPFGWFSVRNDGCMGFNDNSGNWMDPCMWNSSNVPNGMVVNTEAWNLVTVTISDENIKTYVNGNLWYTSNYSDNGGSGSYAGFLDTMVNSNYVILGNSFRNFWTDPGFDGSYDNVLVYDRALTADEVAALATNNADSEVVAEYIADSLNLQVIGMQKGTTVDSQEAIRFVANVDESVVGNEAIVNLGWAWQAGTALDGSYVTPPVTTVADDDTLATEGNYAYTLLFETDTDTNYAVAPYVSVQVGGNTYNFCYNGRYGNFETTNSSSNIVYVPVDFAVVGA